MRERDYATDVEVDGRMILEWVFKKWDGAIDWIVVVQDSDSWRVLVNAVMNLRVPCAEFRDQRVRKDPAPCSWIVSWLVSN